MMRGLGLKCSDRALIMSLRDLSIGCSGAKRLRSSPYMAPPMAFRNTGTCFCSAMSLATKILAVPSLCRLQMTPPRDETLASYPRLPLGDPGLVASVLSRC